jgi:pheophorbide a oxygenase
MRILQVTDPCHVNFTHHGVQGRRENEKGTQITVTSPVSPSGFRLKFTTADITFRAPCLVKYDIMSFASMSLYVVPTKTGYCRMIAKFMRDKSKPLPFKGRKALFYEVRCV